MALNTSDIDLTLKLSDNDAQWSDTLDLTKTGLLKGNNRKNSIEVTQKIENFLASEKTDDPKHTLHKRVLCHRDKLQPGQEVDYELIRVLGKGGMGTVFEAKQNATGRLVALKLLENEDPNVRYEFAREAIINGNLEHPSIIRLYEFAYSDEFGLFYAMERIRGKAWSKVIHKQMMEEKLGIFMRVLDAVAYAHSCGIIHRDLKPANIMLGEFGNILVVDWGLALSTEEIAANRELPNLYGSLPYMAPEMLSKQTKNMGVHSDIYMLGSILYQIMTGNPPHTLEGKIYERVRAIRANDIQPIEDFPLLGKVAMKALSTNPNHRYTSVDTLHHALQNYLQNRTAYLTVQNGREHLEVGRTSQSLNSLSRAFFAFQDALEILPNSETAWEAFSEAEEELAQTAFSMGDLSYASRIASSESFQNQKLKYQIDAAVLEKKQRAKRSKTIGWIASIASVLAIGALSAGLVWMRKGKGESDLALATATTQNQSLDQALTEAKAEQRRLEEALQDSEETAKQALVTMESKMELLRLKIELQEAEAKAEAERRETEAAAAAAKTEETLLEDDAEAKELLGFE